jgi:hypothetical protein
VYVDDLIMVGGKDLRPLIAEIRREIDMEEPALMNRYLGCNHTFSTTGVPGKQVTKYTWVMSGYFEQALQIYKEDTGLCVKPSRTPYVPDIDKVSLDKLLAVEGKWKKLSPHFLMKLLYGVRQCHPGMSLAVQRLSRRVTKWCGECDRRLHRIYEFLEGTDYVMTGSLSQEDLAVCYIAVWPDADLNGDLFDTKSTSGCFIELAGAEGSGRSMPLVWGAKKQDGTAQHTQEAEYISAVAWMRNEGAALQQLFQILLGRPVEVRIMEDNAAMIAAAHKGYSPSLRHLPRMQRTSLGYLYDLLTEEPEEGSGKVKLLKADTAVHKGDMFTKFLVVAKYVSAMQLIGMVNRKKHMVMDVEIENDNTSLK